MEGRLNIYKGKVTYEHTLRPRRDEDRSLESALKWKETQGSGRAEFASA
jgi:hypothetical protein